MAVLRITLSLIFVVCFAAPAVAQQFKPSDLEGPWFIQGAETGSNPDQPGGWVLGSINFDKDGRVLGGSVSNDRNDQTILDSGGLTVNADGSLSGTIGNDETTIEVRGRLLPGKDVLVAVTTTDPSSPTYALVILTKFVDSEQPLFSQADVTGTWRSASLLIPELPARNAETLDGIFTFDGQGQITAGTLRSSNGSENSAVTGNLFVVGSGVFSGAFSIDLGTTVDVSSFQGFMSRDKSLLVGITIRNQPGVDLLQNGIFVLQRQPSGPFTIADAAGRWDLFSLQSQNDRGSNGEWLVGNITVGPNGLITGSLTGPGGEQDDIVDLGDNESNRLRVSPTGLVSGTIVTEVRILELRGAMNAAKDRIGGTDVLDAEIPSLGFFALLKADAVAPPAASTVQFRSTSTAQRITEGTTATLVVERTGASTTAVTVDFQVTGGTATRGSDFNLVSGNLTIPAGNGTLTFAAGETSKTFAVVALSDTEVEGDETVNLALINPTNGAVLGPRATAVVTIGNSAVVQFQQPVYTVKENVVTALITAVRTGASTTPFTVTYTATPITAVRDVDFKLPASNILTFAAGVLTRTLSVTIVNNTLVNGNRSFMLSLGQPTNGVQLGAQSTTNVTIQDDDQPGQFKVDKTDLHAWPRARARCRSSSAALGTSLAGNVTVDYATSEAGPPSARATPQDYASQAGTLTFKAGETMRSVSRSRSCRTVSSTGPRRSRSASARTQRPAPRSSRASRARWSRSPTWICAGVVKFVPDKYSVSENARPPGHAHRAAHRRHRWRRHRRLRRRSTAAPPAGSRAPAISRSPPAP